MLPFRPITLEDKAHLNRHFSFFPYDNSELSFPDLYMWRNSWHIGVCTVQDTLYLFEENKERPSVLMPVLPIREPLPEAVERALAHMRERGMPFRMRSVNDEYKAWLEREMPGRFVFEPDGDFFDYVYNAQDIITLAGKKMHGKRNHLNRFLAENGERFAYRELTRWDERECLDVYDEWLVGRDPAERESLLDERKAIEQTFEDWDDIGMVGGIIRLDGKAAAFTFGEKRQTGLAVVHIEKADASVPGLYVAIAQRFAQNALGDMRWINREEDMGLEGLRRAKQSWNPARMVEKYIVTLREEREDVDAR